jgi:hypothetical protein
MWIQESTISVVIFDKRKWHDQQLNKVTILGKLPTLEVETKVQTVLIFCSNVCCMLGG